MRPMGSRWCAVLLIALIGCGDEEESDSSSGPVAGTTEEEGGGGGGGIVPGLALGWGMNKYGEIGDGTTHTQTTAVFTASAAGGPLLNGVVAVAAGGNDWPYPFLPPSPFPDPTFGGGNHTLALTADGTVRAWGDNSRGQLGNTVPDATYSKTPVTVLANPGGPALTGVVAISAGNRHSTALMSDGTVREWGGCYASGQNFLSVFTSVKTPQAVLDVATGDLLTNVKAIAAGGFHTLALLNDGTVRAWGYNKYGQLGDGTWTNAATAIQVINGVGGPALSNVKAIAAGRHHSVALLNDGTLRWWGSGSGSALPVTVTTSSGGPALSNVKAVAAGNHTLTLLNDGTVRAWGSGSKGQLGNGSFAASPFPVTVLSGASGVPLAGVVAVAAREDNGAALLADGTVRAWGDGHGQLGNGTTGTNSAYPVKVLDDAGNPLSNVQAVAVGTYHMAALRKP